MKIQLQKAKRIEEMLMSQQKEKERWIQDSEGGADSLMK